MAIQVLDQNTINKIAAGEVIERPSSVVKELVENAIDAKATAITIEIKDGGISFIRITDNGSGIEGKDLPLAFLRHSTSKIKSIEDLMSVSSLGFRGEALSSIASVAQVELITKTADSFTGYRYVIEGGEEKSNEEVGAPDGTTFIVRNLFYNTPVRRKFLKTAATEAGYINSLIEHLSLSHPDVSFRFINNNQNKLHTSGNMNLKDIIYSVYGRDITKNLIEVKAQTQDVSITGFIGKPMICRGNRAYENYYINGRYIKSGIITKAIEEAYRGFIMPHNYPFTALHFAINPHILDVNVHPTKMELRFSKNEFVYNFVLDTLKNALKQRELVPEVKVGENNIKVERPAARMAEQNISKTSIHVNDDKERNFANINNQLERKEQPQIEQVAKNESIVKAEQIQKAEQETKADVLGKAKDVFVSESAKAKEIKGTKEAELTEAVESPKTDRLTDLTKKVSEESKTILDRYTNGVNISNAASKFKSSAQRLPEPFEVKRSVQMAAEDNAALEYAKKTETKQMSMFEDKLLDASNTQKYRLIGQLFETYWLIEFEDKFYMMDQHAAHEKVLYERTMKHLKEKDMDTQMIMPPVIISVNMREEEVLKANFDVFKRIGYEIEEFGGNEYKVTGIPASLPKMDYRQLLIDMLDSMVDDNVSHDPDIITEKVASMSCKAAVKGNNKLSYNEAEELMKELMQADNPYNCPHGRPTLIMMSKYEIEKKFKRIV